MFLQQGNILPRFHLFRQISNLFFCNSLIICFRVAFFFLIRSLCCLKFLIFLICLLLFFLSLNISLFNYIFLGGVCSFFFEFFKQSHIVNIRELWWKFFRWNGISFFRNQKLSWRSSIGLKGNGMAKLVSLFVLAVLIISFSLKCFEHSLPVELGWKSLMFREAIQSFLLSGFFWKPEIGKALVYHEHIWYLIILYWTM